MFTKAGSVSSFKYSLSFASFTYWLLAFPMAGPLQMHGDVSQPLIIFLIPHILALLGLAFLFPEKHLEKLTACGCVLSATATFLYGVIPGFAPWALILAGLGGAGFAVRAGSVLAAAERPVVAGGVGLILANFLLILFNFLPFGHNYQLIVTILTVLLPIFQKTPPQHRGELKSLWSYLPFILLYQVIAGLLYGYLAPLYHHHAWVSGAELFIYILIVGIAAVGFDRGRDAILVAGFVGALLACWFIYLPSEPNINLGMWSIQAACGFVDLFLVAILVSRKNSGQSFALGCGVLCSGILAGVCFVEFFGAPSRFLVFSESMVLNMAALIFFFLKRPMLDQGSVGSDKAEIPGPLSKKLSQRENEVLFWVMRGLPYRQISAKIGVSESTVKTYMNRIYEKTETKGKKALVRLIQEIAEQ